MTPIIQENKRSTTMSPVVIKYYVVRCGIKIWTFSGQNSCYSNQVGIRCDRNTFSKFKKKSITKHEVWGNYVSWTYSPLLKINICPQHFGNFRTDDCNDDIKIISGFRLYTKCDSCGRLMSRSNRDEYKNSSSVVYLNYNKDSLKKIFFPLVNQNCYNCGKRLLKPNPKKDYDFSVRTKLTLDERTQLGID